jgi:hypothetical protein
VHDGKARQIVILHQGKGGAGYLEQVIVGPKANYGSGEGGLPGAEIAGQRDEIARFQRDADIDGELLQRALVR